MDKKIALTELTESLIRFPTVAHRADAFVSCFDFIADFFRGTGLTIDRVESNGIPSMIITKHTKTPKVFLCGHIDVVDAPSAQFDPAQHDGKIFGRGALDMKSGVAAMMQLMKDLAGADDDVGLMLTGDEEIGGMNGTKYILDELGYRCQVAILPDGGFAPECVVTEQKGVCFVEVSATGTAAHGSRPWAGDNAIVSLMNALLQIESLHSPATPENNYWVNTMTVAQITGGTSMNMVPPSATAICDIRFIEGSTPEKIIADICRVVPKNISVKEKAVGPMVSLDMNHVLVRPFMDAITTAGKTPQSVLAHGSSDARFFTPYHIPVIMSQPVGGGHHGSGEWVEIASIEEYYDILRTYIERL